MESCPRCTSGLAPRATVCLMCGATIWQPPPDVPKVAVTPAPVALVLPVPVPVPTVEPPPAVRSVIVNLPPQRTSSPEPAPLAPTPPVSTPPPEPTHDVLPATTHAARSAHPFAVGGGAFVALLVVVVLVFALPAHGAKSDQQLGVVGGNPAAAQLDLRHLATAEETNLTATTRYTTDIAALEGVGYMPSPGPPSTIRAGIHGKKGYCLVATNGPSSRWYLYDSKQGGLISQSFASETAAEQACAVSRIKSYATIS